MNLLMQQTNKIVKNIDLLELGVIEWSDRKRQECCVTKICHYKEKVIGQLYIKPLSVE